MSTHVEYYRSLDDADHYFSNRLFSTDWIGASEADKVMALTQAARSIDSLRFTGYKVPVYNALVADPLASQATLEAADATQSKQWPRDSDTMVPDTGLTVHRIYEYLSDPTGGVFAVIFYLYEGATITISTGSLAFDATTSAIQAAVDAGAASTVPNYVAGDIVVSAPFSLTFADATFTYSGDSVRGAHPVRPSVNTSALTGGTFADPISKSTISGECPDRIFFAQCEEAISLLSGKRPDQEFENLVLSSDGVASTRASSDRSQMPPKHTSHFFTSATAWKYLQAFLDEDNGTFTVQRV